MKVKRESEIAQSCPTLSDLTDCSPPGSSVHGISQARVLELVAIAFSERPSTAMPKKNKTILKKNKKQKKKQLLWTSSRKTPSSPLMLNFHLDAYIISLPLKFSNFIKMCHSRFLYYSFLALAWSFFSTCKFTILGKLFSAVFWIFLSIAWVCVYVFFRKMGYFVYSTCLLSSLKVTAISPPFFLYTLL